MDYLYERVREARKLAKLTQEALALELNVSRGAVSQWETEGGTSPSVQNLASLARRSGMSFEYLATGRGPKVFGSPISSEDASISRPLSHPQRQLLKHFDALTPGQRRALVDLLLQFAR